MVAMVKEVAGQKKAGPVLRVLVVEDNRDSADSLGMLLRLWGYDHQVAYDGLSGLELARRFCPDCLILDINLPRLDGYEVARRVRQHPGLERTKLVALSAYSDDEHARRAEEAGFDYRLVKPAAPTELEGVLKMLDEVVRLARRSEELARQNVALASETRELLQGVRADIREVKDEMREIRQELREARGKRAGE